ncbi:MAG: hypothetical protein ACI9U2_001867, partial [Bradymonadia bacterium]
MRAIAWSAGLLTLLIAGSAGAVDVVGNINQDTTWEAAQSPYVVTGNLTVQVGATLTIEPGVIVRVRGAATTITVNGGLVANGEPANRVVVRPDGGDAPGGYEGIAVNANATLTLASTDILWADNPLKFNSPATIQIGLTDVAARDYANTGVTFASGGAFTFGGITLDGGGTGSRGIYVDRIPATLQDMVITDHRTAGIYMRDQDATFRRLVLARNLGEGIYFDQNERRTATYTVDYCTFYANGDALETRRGGSQDFINLNINNSILGAQTGFLIRDSNVNYRAVLRSFSQNVWWGSSIFSGVSNPGNFATSLRYNALLADPDNNNFEPTDRSPARYWDRVNAAATKGAVPHVGAETGAGLHGFWYQNRVFEALSVNDLSGDMVVAAGATVTFRPGSQFRMAADTDSMQGGLNPNLIEIRVEGTLEADGTNSRPVRFTSAAAAPGNGDWYGLVILANTEAFNIAQVDIGYAYRGVSLYSNDHIVAGATIHHSSDAGVWINGGTPEVEQTVVELNNRGIYVDGQATATLREVTARNNTSDGIYVHDSAATINDSLMHDNGGNGLSADQDHRSTRTVALDHCTVAHNTGYGIYTRRGGSQDFLNLQLRSTTISHNTREGVFDGNVNYRAALTCANTNNWGNVRAPWAGIVPSTWNGYSPRGSGCFSENPLFADLDLRNYEPTRFSPLRAMGANGSHVGAQPFTDAIGPQLAGVLWDDFDFTVAASPYTILGDITVPAGVTVTFEPGVVLNIAARTDLMGALPTPTLTEFRFLTGAIATIGGAEGAVVHFRSAAEAPRPGDWAGLFFANAPDAVVNRARLDFPDYGVRLYGPRAAPLTQLEVRHFANVGVQVNQVTQAPTMDILGAQLIGDGNGIGVDINDSAGNVRSTYVTHVSQGIDVYQNARTTYSVYLVNNTVVHASDCMVVRRGGSQDFLRAYVYNNLLVNCTANWLRDNNVNYRTDVYSRHNLHFPQHSNSGVSFRENVNPVLDNPLIEDDDWEAFPRWWDGKVWRQSPAINAGQANVAQIPPIDVTGKARNFANGVDIGAFEHDPDANEEPRADAVADSRMVPRGEAFELDGTAALDPDGQIASAFWTMSDGTITAGLTIMHTFANEGARTAYLTIIDNNGAEDHVRVDLNVNIRPIADAGPAVFQDEGVEESVFFDGTLSEDLDGQVVAWAWDFGDGTPVNNMQNPRHSYLSAGLYTVRLTVTDNEGLSHSDTTLATVFGNDDIVG